MCSGLQQLVLKTSWTGVTQQQAIALTSGYKYANKDQNCAYSNAASSQLRLKTLTAHTGTAIDTLAEVKALVVLHPLAAAIKSCTDFKQYGNGIFSNRNCATTDHAVLIVGYDASSWKVKNSWGTTWGNKGFGNVLY
jgi:hypothetical protein